MSVDRQTRHVRLGWVCSAFDRFGRVLLRDITVVDVSGTSSSTGVLFGVEAQAVRSLLTARRRTLAVGIGVSGIGLGTLLVAPLAAELIARYGWRNAYLVLAAVSTVALAGCGLLVRAAPTATTDAEAAPLLDRLGTPTYLRLHGSGLLLSIVLFVPFVHLPAYAVSRGASDVAAATLVGVIGAASIVGRLALGAAAARTGVLHTYQACFAVVAGSSSLWLGAPGIRAWWPS